MGRGIIVAQWKTGKSLLALQLAHCAALGQPFLGFTIPNAVQVLYIDGEIGSNEFQSRLAKMAAVYPGAARNIEVISFPTSLLEAVQGAYPAKLVIIDPAIKLGYGNENDNALVRAKLDEVSDILMRWGAATVVVHHTRKPSRDSAVAHQGLNEARGAGAFLDWVDGGLEMLKTGDDFRISFVTRGAKTPTPIVLERDEETLTYSVKGAATELNIVIEEEVMAWQEENRTAKRPSKEALVSRLMVRLGRGRTTVYGMLTGVNYNKYGGE